MIMKVKPEVLMDESCTRTSYFVRFLLRLCFFPIYLEGQKVRFSLFSWKTLVHLAINIGVFSLLLILGMQMSGYAEYAITQFLLVSYLVKPSLEKYPKHYIILSDVQDGTYCHNLGHTF